MAKLGHITDAGPVSSGGHLLSTCFDIGRHMFHVIGDQESWNLNSQIEGAVEYLAGKRPGNFYTSPEDLSMDENDAISKYKKHLWSMTRAALSGYFYESLIVDQDKDIVEYDGE